MKKLRIFLVSLLSLLAIIAMCIFGACTAKKYTLHFETFGGTEIADKQLKKGAKISKPKKDPEKDMFIFVGWFEDEKLENEFNFKKTKMPAADKTVYAKWQSAVESVRIFFDSNGGSEVDFKVGEVGSVYTAPEAPVRLGYDFGGWYTDPACTNAFTSTVFPENDITLYAKWNDSSSYAYITYYGNGVLMQRKPVEKGSKIEELSLPSENEQTIGGWFTDEAMTKPFTFGGNATENVTLYTSYYTKGLEINNGVVTGFIPKYAAEDSNKIKTVYVPSFYEGKSVTAIGDDAFCISSEANDITKIVLPDTITKIGERAFYDCRYLTSINLTENVTQVGKFAFHNNERLTDFGDISSLKEIAEGTFTGCTKLTKVTLPEGLTSIGAQAFADCELLNSINIPSSVNYIEAQAFENCKKLTEITLPAGIDYIGNNAFNGCVSLEKVNVPAAVLEQYKATYGELKVTDGVILKDLLTAITA